MADPLVVTMLPAKEGDCLVIGYGPENARKYVLIDGGRAWTYENALKRYLFGRGISDIELMVVTHVDRDHIDGMLSLMQDATLDLNVKNIWFNTWAHLIGETVEIPTDDEETETFGAKMGEELSPLIVRRGWPWNRQFGGGAVVLADSQLDNTIRIEDLKLTLLSPNRAKLDNLKPVWETECEKAGITPGASLAEYVEQEDEEFEGFGAIDIDKLAAEVFKDDESAANGSSIAFILEYGGRKLLLAGDAHADLLEQQLRLLGASAHDPLMIDAFKIPHHGSKYNLSKSLLELLDCKHYLVSTNGNYFKHPEEVAIARLVKFGTQNLTIHFNYRTEYNAFWQNVGWEKRYRYRVDFPDDGKDGYKEVRL